MSKINKQRKTWTVEQKLDYAKLMVQENQLLRVGKNNILMN